MTKHSQPVAPVPATSGQSTTIDEARAAIEAEKNQRAEQCQQEINAALQKHRCQTQLIEVRVNGEVQQVTLRIVAMD